MNKLCVIAYITKVYHVYQSRAAYLHLYVVCSVCVCFFFNSAFSPMMINSTRDRRLFCFAEVIKSNHFETHSPHMHCFFSAGGRRERVHLCTGNVCARFGCSVVCWNPARNTVAYTHTARTEISDAIAHSERTVNTAAMWKWRRDATAHRSVCDASGANLRADADAAIFD